MARILNDDFDIVAKKYLKLKSVPFEKIEGGFDNVLRDRDNNLIIIIKKTANSVEGYGLDCLLNGEGSIDWINKILLRMSSPNEDLYSEQNSVIAKEIKEALKENKLRRILIYCKIDTPIYIASEYNKNGVWRYFESAEYSKKEKIIYDSVCNMSTIDVKVRKKFDENVDFYKNIHGDDCFSKEYLTKKLTKEFDRIKNAVMFQNAFIGTLDMIARHCLGCGTYLRYTNGNVKDLIDSIYTYGRLEYLANLVQTIKYSGQDCYFSVDLLTANVVDDKKLINAYIKTKPGPFKVAGKYLVNLTNAIYAINNNDDLAKRQIKEKIEIFKQFKTATKSEIVMSDCLINIMSQDYLNLSEPIERILGLYKGQGMTDYISIQALAFYSLAYFDPARGDKPMPPEPNHKYWDSELWHEIIKADQKREYIIDVAKVSPLLKKWMDELPEKIDLNELVESLKKNM